VRTEKIGFGVTMTQRGKGILLLVLAAAVAAPAAWAASPTVSTNGGNCGGARDLCEPAADPLGTLPFPLAAPLVTATGPLYGLDSGDDVSSLSLGHDRFTPASFMLVSVDSATTACSPPAGIPDICSEASDAPPQAKGDVYYVGTPGAPDPSLLVLDGDGEAAGFPAPPPPFPGIGLAETSGEDVDALDGCSVSGASTGPIYFTLAPGSPTLGTLGASAADVLTASGGGSPSVAFTAASIGLTSGDVIDALAFDGSSLRLSLAPGSPTLTSLSASPADILASAGGPSGPITVADTLPGLTPTDNVDALAIMLDADFDLVNDECDACPVANNGNQSDGDGDGEGDACDPCTVASAGQNATKARLSLRKLDKEHGEQSLSAKGSFVPAVTSPTIDPGANGVEIRLSDADAGTLVEVSIPGGAPGAGCDPKDGWTLKGTAPGTPGKKVWKYINRSGSVDPPLCAPGTARGITKVIIKDLDTGTFRYIVKGKNVTLSAEPSEPVGSLRFSLGLQSQPEPGFAGAAAMVGQCSDSLLGGAGVCEQVPTTGPVKTIRCKAN
jgi:hypothetical protein